MDNMINAKGHLTIPNDGSVTEIGEKAYFDDREIRSASIPDAVTTLGKGCFAESDLESVEIGHGITEIPEYAFDGCKLKKLVVPGTVKKIDEEAFARCELESVTLEDGVETLGKYSFFNNAMLETLNIPNSVKQIDARAFDYCFSLTEISFAGTMEEWENVWKGYAWCDNRVTVRCQNGTVTGNDWIETLKFAKKEDGTYSVYAREKEKLPSHLVIPSFHDGIPVTAIHRGGFQDCRIESVTVPESVTEIGAFAFRNCTSLSDIRLPDTLQKIGEWAFCDTAWETAHERDEAFYLGNNLVGARPASDVFAIREGTRCIGACIACENEWNAKIVTIPASVVAITDGAFATAYDFSDHSATEAFVVDPANPRYGSEDNCLIEKNTKRLIAGCKKSAIPAGVTVIGSMAFMDSGISSVVIPEGVVSIQEAAFMDCWDLAELTLPDSLKTIGENAFSGCGLRAVRIPDSVTKIGENSFAGSNPASLEIGSGLSEIPDFAFSASEFRECPLRSVTIPGNVKKVGASAFSQCDHLQTVRVEEGVESIGEFAFFNDRKLAEVTLPATLRSIAGNVFDLCVSLREIRYAGTSGAWKAVKKAGDWCGERRIPVVCEDETII